MWLNFGCLKICSCILNSLYLINYISPIDFKLIGHSRNGLRGGGTALLFSGNLNVQKISANTYLEGTFKVKEIGMIPSRAHMSVNFSKRVWACGISS